MKIGNGWRSIRYKRSRTFSLMKCHKANSISLISLVTMMMIITSPMNLIILAVVVRGLHLDGHHLILFLFLGHVTRERAAIL